jgi:hypothetical protein
LAVRPEFITEAANSILAERLRDPDARVGTAWTTRFVKRHGYHKVLQKKLNSNRAASEDVARTEEYFRKLLTVIREYGIVAADIWNMDETGFRIGVGRDTQLIITKRRRAHYFSMTENRESATAVEAVSAGGEVCPAFLILSGERHMARMYQQANQDPRACIAVTKTGYTNDELAMKWIKHFEEHTRDKTIGGKRLLIVDGHGSHHTKQFIKFCDDHNIIPFGLPPHMTHLLQPLDVVVFQPLKHYFCKELDILVRDGLTSIGKLEFLSMIEGVRAQAFKRSTILSAFKKAGISPFNPQPILNDLTERAAKRTPTPPLQAEHPLSSPFKTPRTVRQFNSVTDYLEQVIEECFSPESTVKQRFEDLFKGARVGAAEVHQLKKDLARTDAAKKAAQLRKAAKNTPLQSGGVLTVEEGREMVRQKDLDKEAEALRVLETARKKRYNARKRFFEAAAKLAREWYMADKLPRAAIYETGYSCRFLKRF